MRGKIVAGKYRLNLPLGSGGMAEVWSATNTFTERQVAIKFLSQRVGKSPEHAARFLKEAKVSARINHPNIIDVLDVGQTEEGQLFLVMELLTGFPLDTALRRQTPPMMVDELVRIMMDVAEALGAAHKAGIVHRDLKPTNIFLHTGGSTKGQLVPKVLDFGVSKFLEDDAALTIAGTVLGSPLYMSPEQARGESNVDGRTDIFAFGAILFEALCGHRPYDAKNFNALIVKIATTQPKSIDVCAPHAPESLRRVVRACMETDRERRARTFEEVLAGLRIALADLETSPRRLPSPLIPAAVVDPDATNALPVVRGSERPGPAAEAVDAAPERHDVSDTVPSMPPPAHVSGSIPPGTVSIPPWPAAPGSSGTSWTPNTSYASVSVPPPPRRSAGLLVAAGTALVAAGVVIGAAVAARPRADASATSAVRATAALTTEGSSVATSTVTTTSAEQHVGASASEPPTVSVDALPGAASPQPPIAKGSGRLTLAASPGRCAITVDGKDRGVTPVAALDLPAGTHEVLCRTAEGKERTASVTVRDGAVAKYRFALDD